MGEGDQRKIGSGEKGGRGEGELECPGPREGWGWQYMGRSAGEAEAGFSKSVKMEGILR